MLPNSTTPTQLKLVSNREDCYSNMLPMMFGIGLGWVMVGIGILASCVAFGHNAYFAGALMGSAFIFALFLLFNTYNLIRQSNCDYIIEITDHDATFCKIDRLQKKKTNKFILLADIKYAEYYPYLDCASIIFHTSYAEIEMPLWPMGKCARDAVDFLEGTGVKIVDVQSDQAIPD